MKILIFLIGLIIGNIIGILFMCVLNIAHKTSNDIE